MSEFNLKFVKEIVSTDNPKLLVEQADAIGRQVAGVRLTTNQIRNIYGPVRQIELSWPQLNDKSTEDDRKRASSAYRQVVLLKPKMGYLAARDPKLQDLETILSAGVDSIQEARDDADRRARFKRFVEFFEAILAYHKKYEKSGGR